ncbi:MAG: hypothetical protein Q4G25_00505 [Paracoccus sp. (in: a-proteobacteria)]|nr:hypothetical protein [Paracoccus sp. (in: a-proteobacteria)]
MTEIPTTYETDESLDALERLPATSSSLAEACIPRKSIGIYPVRIAWADLRGQVDDGFTYPTSLAPFNGATNPQATGGFTLRKLREGNVMIYDIAAGVWSMFVCTYTGGSPEGSFTHYHWREGQTEWQQSLTPPTRMPHVPDSATEIQICFVEHSWSRETFMRAHYNTDGFRDKLMTRVTLTAPSDATFSAPLNNLPERVEEFSGAGVVQTRTDWSTLSDIPIPRGARLEALNDCAYVRHARVPPVMVALHDPIGVVREMAMSHTNRTALRAEYLEANAYALTTARASQVLQRHASSQIATGDLGFFDRRVFAEWGTSTRPERDTFLVEAEETLQNFETNTRGSLAAWAKYLRMGMAAPANTPGSLQTQLLHYDRNPSHAREIVALIEFALSCVASISSSLAGQAMIREVVLNTDNWTHEKNPIVAAMESGELLKLGASAVDVIAGISNYRAAAISASSALMRDLSMPLAMEIAQLGRVDLLQTVNRFSNGIINKQFTQQIVDIDNVMAEIHSRPTGAQQTKLLRRGRRRGQSATHTIRVPQRLYMFTGMVHVAGPGRIDRAAIASAGFGIFGNALNLISLSSGPDRATMAGQSGRIGSDPNIGMVLTTIETMTMLMSLSNELQSAPTAGHRSYFVSGQLTRTQLTALTTGKAASDDLVRTLTGQGRLAAQGVAEVGASRVMSWVGRVATGVGIGLAAMDLLKANEAFNRGDGLGVTSAAMVGVGGLLMAVGVVGGASTSVTIVGAVVGLILVVLGVVLSFFTDDPVTRWLKNCYWGISPSYLYWDSATRGGMILGGSIHRGQRAEIQQGRRDFRRYLAREMQEFNEFIYWPQKLQTPLATQPTERRGSWPFGTNSSVTAAHVKVLTVGFRLPNFIPGYSEFDGRVIAQIYNANGRYGHNRYQDFDVTDQFRESISVDDDGVVSGRFSITFGVPRGNNSILHANPIRWHINSVRLERGWTYTPLTEITLPMNYNDPLFGREWTERGAGAPKGFEIYAWDDK